ncbi:hypothetical protein ACLKA6_001558 [Drosophila palustris]
MHNADDALVGEGDKAGDTQLSHAANTPAFQDPTGLAHGSRESVNVQAAVADFERNGATHREATKSGTSASVGAGTASSSSTPVQHRFNSSGYGTVITKPQQEYSAWGAALTLPYQANTAVFNQASAPLIGAFGSVANGTQEPGLIGSAGNTQQPSNMHFGSTPTRSGLLTSTQISARQVISRDLRIFTGKPDEWLIFISNYEQSTERCGFSNAENLIRLQKCLRGQALESVRGKLMVPETVPYAIGTLRMLYGRSEIVHAALQRKLRDEPAIKAENLDSVIRLALAVQNYCATMAAVGLHEYLHDPVLLNELVAKMPCSMKLEWGRHRLANHSVNLATFDNWLFNVAMCATMVTPYEPQQDDIAKRNPGRKERLFVHNVTTSSEIAQQSPSRRDPDTTPCPKCIGAHHLAECDDFRGLSIKQRWEFIKSKRLCFCCFMRHLVRNCKAKRDCGVDGCTSIHHVLLHTASSNGNRGGTTEQTSSHVSKKEESALMFHGKTAGRALFRYIPITLYGKSKCVHTYALADDGAACTLMERSLADELELEGPASQLCLKWTGDVSKTEQDSKTLTVNVSAMKLDTRQYTLKGVRTVTDLDLPEQSLQSQLLRSRSHLFALPIEPYTEVRARIIIGLDNIKTTVPLEMREAEGDDIIATRCRLGWAVYGRAVKEDATIPRLLHICQCSETRGMDDALKNYFSLESLGITVTSSPLRSKDDERAMKIMEATTSFREKEKRWQTGLLWKFDRVVLPDSYQMALKRLKCLEAKMSKDPQLKEFMLATMNSHKHKGYIRRLEDSELAPNDITWFLPIFTVTNPNKKKTRLVWDAAARSHGVSLNDCLLKGPDTLASLMGILIRFRERPIAVSGDIREMFHQVKVRPEDQAAQKFLWRDGNSLRPPETYVMQVMTFGASCSPALASYVLSRNAKRYEADYPEAVKAICRNTFVDDWLQSVDTESEMIELAMAVKSIHANGGFDMRHWTSNSQKVVCTLENDPEILVKPIISPDVTQEKVLGMWWQPTKDWLTFMVKPDTVAKAQDGRPTKRRVLSMVMSIFDPLGLLGFFNIRAKIILQNVWRSNTGWDEPLREEDEADWRHWLDLVPKLNDVCIPRCLSGVSNSRDLQIHTFVDASINAYAAAVFLRAEENGQVHCSLVASKTRVAPLKPVSIPRMELMAAVLGLRLTKCIEMEMSVRVKKRVYWTDSKDVLWWIRSDARKFQQFVALRIGEILEGSEVDSWRWVPSAQNVADDGTKWNRTPEINVSNRWFNGPSFLYQDDSQWPQTDIDYKQRSHLILQHEEMQSQHISPLSCISPDPTRFSKIEELRAVQLRILDFLRSVTKKSPGAVLKSLLELKRSEMDVILIRVCQEQEFFNEFKCLKSERGTVERKSSIFKCSPYIDEMGILRIKGRIDLIEGVEINVKRPIILPRRHRLAFLMVESYHRRYHHLHDEIVVNELRQRFWIFGLRALVREVSSACHACKIRRARPEPPEMGNLPQERLSPHTPPFTYTGVDYFGPIDIIVGRRHEKRWGVLFTCLTMRAVHLEIATSLSTDSILKAEVERISTREVEQRYPEMEFVFIPPGSSHMGGAWERLVRSTKSILSEILPSGGLREEILRAALADVECTINSRPLTYVPLESPESEALTPNHFLLGHSSGLREKGSEVQSGAMLAKGFRVASQLADQFWKRWLREYLPTLTRRTKWFQPSPDPIAIDDIVVVVDENSKRNSWPKGVVLDVHRSRDGQVRSAVVRTMEGMMTRPAVKLAKLDLRVGNTQREC